MRIIRGIICACFAVLAAGCMGTIGYSGMTADQIKALGKESNISCTDGTTVWGRVRNVFVNVDKSVIEKGGIVVDKDCGITFQNEKVPGAPRTTLEVKMPTLPPLPPLEWALPQPAPPK